MKVLRSKGLRRVALVVLVFASVLVGAAQAQALPFFPFPILFQGVQGVVTVQGSPATRLPGIIVSSYETSTGALVGSTATDQNGAFTLTLVDGEYNLHYSDPTRRYGDQWYWSQANFENSTPIDVTGSYSNGDVSLRPSATLKVVVRRAGHPFTRLSGKSIVLQQQDSGGFRQEAGTASTSGGTAAFSGLRSHNVSYLSLAYDPKGWFWNANSNGGWLTFADGSANSMTIDMTMGDASKDVTVSVPAAKASQKKGKAFTVTGKLTKRVTSPKTIQLVAVKSGSGSTKTFNAKIKAKTSSSTYSGSVKLTKGTWTIYAVFAGNSALAPTDSAGKVFYVK